MNIGLIYFFTLIAATSLGQEIRSSDSTLVANQAIDSADNEGFFLSLDAKNENLLIPPSNGNLKIIGIKIFNQAGKELISRRIKDGSKLTSINIFKLADGDYIVHIVTVEQAIYKTRFVIRR